jgi:hypothetical protein
MFHWQFLRTLTCDLNLRLDALAGIHLQRLSPDTLAWNGAVYRYVIACTFADVWCGSIAFLWSLRRSIAHNLAFIATFTLALLAFNILRLSVSDVLFAAGLSWNLAHNVLSGFAYFAVWSYLAHHLRREGILH